VGNRLSRKIINIQYDAEIQELVLMFRGGIVKKYRNVPENTYKELSSNPEPTIYYEENIIGQYLVN
jgi:hypothetical protein